MLVPHDIDVLEKQRKEFIEEQEKEFAKKQEVVDKNEKMIDNFKTDDLKIRKRPKKLVVSIEENNILIVLTKLANQGLKIMDYIKKLEWNDKMIKQAFDSKIINSEDAKVELVEQQGILKFD